MSFGDDKNFDFEVVIFPVQIAFEASRIADPAVRVVHKADQSLAIGVRSIALYVDNQLLADVSCFEAFPRFFTSTMICSSLSRKSTRELEPA